MHDVTIIIPARYASTRLKSKMLVKIAKKTLIQHVWEKAIKANVDDVIIACDHEIIKSTVESFGGNAVMTGLSHSSGTDRIAEVAKSVKSSIIVNLQGDEPMMEQSMINQSINALKTHENAKTSTLITLLNEYEDLSNPNIVKVIIDNKGYAIYFSRLPIPYVREKKDIQRDLHYKHLGIYCYRRDFLLQFSSMTASILEKSEKLEQLRIIENGYKIITAITQNDAISIDTPEDLVKVRKKLEQVNIS